MNRWLRWGVPVAAVVLGFVVSAAGFAYDLAFAGLPYQDPTPEMQARWRFHQGVASLIELSGVGVLLLGTAGLAVVGVWSLVTWTAAQELPR
jgi:hypothetical protein